MLASVETFAVFAATAFCGVVCADAGAGIVVAGCVTNGLAGSLEPLKLNEVPKPLFGDAPNKLVMTGFVGWVFTVGNPNVGFACICGGFVGVEVAPVSGIENVKLLICWKSFVDDIFGAVANDCCGGVFCWMDDDGFVSNVICLNWLRPDWSGRFCGGEQISTLDDWKFNKLNDRRNPWVDKMCNIGITGIWFSPEKIDRFMTYLWHPVHSFKCYV